MFYYVCLVQYFERQGRCIKLSMIAMNTAEDRLTCGLDTSRPVFVPPLDPGQQLPGIALLALLTWTQYWQVYTHLVDLNTVFTGIHTQWIQFSNFLALLFSPCWPENSIHSHTLSISICCCCFFSCCVCVCVCACVCVVCVVYLCYVSVCACVFCGCGCVHISVHVHICVSQWASLCV